MEQSKEHRVEAVKWILKRDLWKWNTETQRSEVDTDALTAALICALPADITYNLSEQKLAAIRQAAERIGQHG